MPFSATWMDLEVNILSVVSQTQKDKDQVLTYDAESKKENKNLKTKLKDTENRFVVARRRGWGWAKWVKGVKSHKINKSWEVIYSTVTIVNNTVLRI